MLPLLFTRLSRSQHPLPQQSCKWDVMGLHASLGRVGSAAGGWGQGRLGPSHVCSCAPSTVNPCSAVARAE